MSTETTCHLPGVDDHRTVPCRRRPLVTYPAWTTTGPCHVGGDHVPLTRRGRPQNRAVSTETTCHLPGVDDHRTVPCRRRSRVNYPAWTTTGPCRVDGDHVSLTRRGRPQDRAVSADTTCHLPGVDDHRTVPCRRRSRVNYPAWTTTGPCRVGGDHVSITRRGRPQDRAVSTETTCHLPGVDDHRTVPCRRRSRATYPAWTTTEPCRVDGDHVSLTRRGRPQDRAVSAETTCHLPGVDDHRTVPCRRRPRVTYPAWTTREPCRVGGDHVSLTRRGRPENRAVSAETTCHLPGVDDQRTVPCRRRPRVTYPAWTTREPCRVGGDHVSLTRRGRPENRAVSAETVGEGRERTGQDRLALQLVIRVRGGLVLGIWRGTTLLLHRAILNH